MGVKVNINDLCDGQADSVVAQTPLAVLWSIKLRYDEREHEASIDLILVHPALGVAYTLKLHKSKPAGRTCTII